MTPTSAVRVAIALVERDGLWLVDRRRTSDMFNGCWEFPGGKIRPGESPAEAAVRECAEEVGVEVLPREELSTVEHDYPMGRVVLYPVVCRMVGGEARPQAREVGEVRWASLGELRSLAMPEANGAILHLLDGWLARAGSSE